VRLSRRLLAATVGVVVAAVVGAGPVAGQTTPSPPPAAPDCANTGLGAGCGSGTSTSGNGTGTATSGGGGPAVPVDYERYFDEDGTGVGAEPGYEDDGCWGIRVVPEGQGVSYEEAVADQNAQGENGVLWGNCEIEETIDPAVLAEAYWYRSVRPPPPTPLQVDPGKALTGLPAYLEIGGEIPFQQSFGTPIGTLTFTMTPRYVVSWGDGATSETETQGGPYPDGDVTHTYVEEGGVTITVQAFWRTTWTLAGAGGDLPELPVPTEGSLDLPVEQRQAVIDPG
jgi:hypothetical protein